MPHTQRPDMYRGDLKPDLVLTLPVPVDTADSVQIFGVMNGQKVVNVYAWSATGTTVVHQWSPGQTATAGDLYLEVQVTWPEGKPQTFRVEEPWVIAQDFG